MELKDIVDCATKLNLSPEATQAWIDEKDKEARQERLHKRNNAKELQELLNADKENQRKNDDKIRQDLEAAKQKDEERKQKDEERKQKDEERREKERLFEIERLEKETERVKQEIALAATKEKMTEEEKQQRELDRQTKVQIAEKTNESKLKAKQMELDSKAELDATRRHETKEIPKHKKYQHIIKGFTKDDNFPAWLKNMERCLREDNIPGEDWAFILKKSLSGEPQRLIENIGERDISNYEYLKEKLLSHFKCDAAGRRVQFRTLTPKSNQTFFDYLTEVEATLDHWLEAEAVDKSYERFHNMIMKDKILASIPSPMAKFLMEQRITNMIDLEQKGTAYFNANRDVFSMCSQPDLELGATATWSKDKKPKQSSGSWTRYKTTNKYQSSGFKDPKCKYCHKTHNIKSLCDSSPEGKTYLKKHIKYAADKRKQCALEGKCFCCKLINHSAKFCPCKQRRQYTNAVETTEEPTRKLTTKYMRHYMHSLGLDTDTEEDQESSSSAEDEWQVNAADIHNTDQEHECTSCKMFHEYGILECGHLIPHVDIPANAARVTEGKLKLYPGKVNHVNIDILRDTGATLIGVHKELVSEKDYTGDHVICRTFGGTKERYPLAWIDIDSAFLKDKVLAAVLTNPCASLILGNVDNIKDCSESDIQQWINEQDTTDAMAVTRNQSRLTETNLQEEALESVMPINPEMDKRDVFIKAQKNDESLSKCFQLANEKAKATKTAKWKFAFKKGILTRIYSRGKETMNQVVLPTTYRHKALELAHNNPFAGHLGSAKTKNRILYQFYWPGFTQTIRTFCKSCHICQMKSPKGRHPKAFVQPTDLASRPFQKIAVDIVGPLNVVSDRGNRFILTMVDLCTRWPEALPLKFITSEAITQAFFQIFSRIGFPEVILSDRGTQFISSATQAVSKLLGIKQIFTTPYNPQANGICENFNGTLKKMLAKVTEEHPSTWDNLLPAILFAYREVPQRSTGFSPFELVYGANPRGPLAIYRDLLIGKLEDPENRTNAELVTNLRDKILTSCQEAKEALKDSGAEYRYYANRKARKIELSPGDKVLLLLPDKNDKLAISWQGPYDVNKKISDVDYQVKVKDKLKIYHINMLKPFTVQETESKQLESTTEEGRVDTQIASSLITDKDSDTLPTEIVLVESDDKASWKDCKLDDRMPTHIRNRIIQLLREFGHIFSNIPGSTNLIQHHIEVSTEAPVRVKPYPIPVHYVQQVEKEIDDLQELGIITRSTSYYCSPIVIIKKKDGTLRICVDYRKLNAITIPDAEPIPNVDDLIVTLAHSKIFSKLDMTKGYYQIPMSKQSRHLTAFAAPQGLFEWLYMPFGLVNAPATFVRMTRLLLRGVQNITTYMDDMCINNDNYDQHIRSLKEVFQRIEKANLTVKPSKVEIGFQEIAFLGHNISKGNVTTDDKIVSKILKLEPPTTKKQVRSVIGLMNYYAKFIPRFSEKTSMFSSLLQKSSPNKIIWNETLQTAFQELKDSFSMDPVLKIPNYRLPFVLQTDASNIAIAGCLLQPYNDILHPVLYISRKLNEAERNYSTIEKEALAIIFCILRLKKYLLGRKFLILTDSKPLTILTSKLPKNSRLTRWSLILQDYVFEVRHIKGIQNCLPDALSRL